MNRHHFMHRCLQLATQGRGLVGINPLVGAVLVRNENIIAEGYYRGPGTDHAEVDLIKKFDQQILQTDGLYVNLEPCNHIGNTPPCTDAIINAGIKKVMYGMQDPDARVSGQGILQLESAGIEVIGPILRAQCERLNRGYVSLRKHSRPYITLKKAQTINGQIANQDGSKLCITSDAQNRWSHEYLRSTHDAILVGVQTVVTDDPELTIRITNYESGIMNQPWRIILDPDLRIPIDAKVLGDRCLVIKESREANEAKEKILHAKGVKIVATSITGGQYNLQELCNHNSQFIVQNSISSILVEGGPKTWKLFTDAGIVDEEVTLIGIR